MHALINLHGLTHILDLKTRDVTEQSILYLFDTIPFLLHVPLCLSLTILCFFFLLGTLSVGPSLWVTPPVRLRGTGHSWATRPLGEGKGRGGAGPGTISIPGRVERPQRGLGRSPSLLLSARRLIGTALNSSMHG